MIRNLSFKGFTESLLCSARVQTFKVVRARPVRSAGRVKKGCLKNRIHFFSVKRSSYFNFF